MKQIASKTGRKNNCQLNLSFAKRSFELTRGHTLFLDVEVAASCELGDDLPGNLVACIIDNKDLRVLHLIGERKSENYDLDYRQAEQDEQRASVAQNMCELFPYEGHELTAFS